MKSATEKYREGWELAFKVDWYDIVMSSNGKNLSATIHEKKWGSGDYGATWAEARCTEKYEGWEFIMSSDGELFYFPPTGEIYWTTEKEFRLDQASKEREKKNVEKFFNELRKRNIVINLNDPSLCKHICYNTPF